MEKQRFGCRHARSHSFPARSGRLQQAVSSMRKVIFVIVLIGAFFVFDAVAFNGHYGNAAWREAQEQGHRFNYQMQYWFRKFK